MLPLAALVLAAAVLIGALLAQVVSGMPLAIHACAEQHGRHVLLGSAAEGARPSAGHRISPPLAVRTIAPQYAVARPGGLRPASDARRAAFATLDGVRAIVGKG